MSETPRLRIAGAEEKLNEGAVSLLEEALAVARDPAEKVEGCAILLFKANKTYASWWSAQTRTVEKVGYLEAMKLQLLLDGFRPEEGGT